MKQHKNYRINDIIYSLDMTTTS